jgi:DNA-binding CsgD family transcriptional regulator
VPVVVDQSRLPRFVGAAAEQLLAARREPERVMRHFQSSRVPMFLVDGDRRYVEANRPARLIFRLRQDELRRLQIADLTPREMLPALDVAWDRLMASGCVAGEYEVAGLDGGSFGVVYCAAAEVLGELHLIAFAPLGWPQDELTTGDFEGELGMAPLTRRELEILELAADGLSGPEIAADLIVSPGTVRTHFENLYAKLAVGDRAAAVARAMRLGLIA